MSRPGVPIRRSTPAESAADRRAVLDLYARGLIRPVISARFRLEDAPAALERLAARGVAGKIVVTVD